MTRLLRPSSLQILATFCFLLAFVPPGTAQEGPDLDGDGIPNALEINGYFYDSSTGLQACDPAVDVFCFQTDFQQWSTDGDPFSDFDEVSGANMPIEAPYDHPYVAAEHIIAVTLAGYTVTPTATITDSRGGSVSSAYEVSVTNTVEETISGTATAAVGPGGLFGYSVTASRTESQAVTESSTLTREINWSTSTTVDLNAAAELSLQVYIFNAGSAQVRNPRLAFNLRIGNAVVASLRTAAVTTLLGAGQQYPAPEEGPFVISRVEDASGDTRPITLTLDQLKAIQLGAPITLAVTEVQGEILRWSPEGGGSWSCPTNITCDWASFQNRIQAQTVNLMLHIGDDRRQFRVFGGADYANPADPDLNVTLRDLLDLVADVEGPNEAAVIEDYPYPTDWYAMTGSDEVVAAWEAAGAPQNLLGLNMIPGTDLRLAAPGGDPNPRIDMATYAPDLRRVYVSARAQNGFPLREVTARVTIEGVEQTVTLEPDEQSGFYTHSTPFASPAAGGGQVTVTNARGDETTRTLQLPVSQSASCDDIEAAYALVSDGEYLLFKDGDLAQPARAFCRFFPDAAPQTFYWIDRTPEGEAGENITLAGVSFVNAQEAYAVGSSGDPTEPNLPVVLRTLDAGATWESATVTQVGTDPELRSVDFKPDGSVGIAVGFDYDGVSQGYAIYRSTNGGATWVNRGNFDVRTAFPRFEEVRYAGGETWFAGGGARFMRSNDDGETWEDVAVDFFSEDPRILDIEFKDASNGLVIASRRDSTPDFALYATTDGGTTWSVRSSFDGADTISLSKIVHLGGTDWIGGRTLFDNDDESAELYRSVDDGVTWTLIADASNLGAVRFIDLEFTSPERGFVLDQYFDANTQARAGRIWRTEDGGATWESETLMSGGEPLELSMYDANRGIVVGTEGVLITTSGGGNPRFTVDAEQYDPADRPEAVGPTLASNYPNPFRGQTTLTFSLESPEAVTLDVYDLMGRRVATLLQHELRSAGTHNVRFDGSRLAPGLYLLRIETTTGSATKRMTLVR